METSRRYIACNIDIPRASFAKHVRSEKHIGNRKPKIMNKPEWLFLEPIEKKNIEKLYT